MSFWEDWWLRCLVGSPRHIGGGSRVFHLEENDPATACTGSDRDAGSRDPAASDSRTGGGKSHRDSGTDASSSRRGRYPAPGADTSAA